MSLSTDDDKCESCPEILEELETIDDDTDKHGIQFVKANDPKLAAEIGVFSFPALVYYETGVPIMYDGKSQTIHPRLARSRSTPSLGQIVFVSLLKVFLVSFQSSRGNKDRRDVFSTLPREQYHPPR